MLLSPALCGALRSRPEKAWISLHLEMKVFGVCFVRDAKPQQGLKFPHFRCMTNYVPHVFWHYKENAIVEKSSSLVSHGSTLASTVRSVTGNLSKLINDQLQNNARYVSQEGFLQKTLLPYNDSTHTDPASTVHQSCAWPPAKSCRSLTRQCLTTRS